MCYDLCLGLDYPFLNFSPLEDLYQRFALSIFLLILLLSICYFFTKLYQNGSYFEILGYVERQTSLHIPHGKYHVGGHGCNLLLA